MGLGGGYVNGSPVARRTPLPVTEYNVSGVPPRWFCRAQRRQGAEDFRSPPRPSASITDKQSVTIAITAHHRRQEDPSVGAVDRRKLRNDGDQLRHPRMGLEYRTSYVVGRE